MRLAYDAQGIIISYYDAGSPITIVTFASLGVPPGPVPHREFHKALRRPNPIEVSFIEVNIVTVVDAKRRWYMDGNTSTICRVVNSILDKTGSVRTITLGTSMGGFAAIAFAGRLRHCQLALAFGGHSSIHPSIAPFDTRSKEWRRQIKRWEIVDCLDEIVSGVNYHLVFGSLDKIDGLHAERFLSCGRSNVVVEFVNGSAHNVPMHWQQNGILEAQLYSYLRLNTEAERNPGSRKLNRTSRRGGAVIDARYFAATSRWYLHGFCIAGAKKISNRLLRRSA